MAHNEKYDLPSYEESTASSSFVDRAPRGQQILEQLALTRTKHLRSIVDDRVCPLIEQRAERGLSHTIIALIPPDSLPQHAPADKRPISDSERDSSPAVEVLGLASGDDDVEEVILTGEMDSAAFWRQSEVISELRMMLEDKLLALPRLSRGRITEAGTVQTSSTSAQQQKTGPRRGLFGRVKAESNAPVHLKQEQPARRGLPPPTMRITVELQEICLRTLSDFGLYETLTRPAVVIDVRVL